MPQPLMGERHAQWLTTHGLHDRSYISPELRIRVEEQETLRAVTILANDRQIGCSVDVFNIEGEVCR